MIHIVSIIHQLTDLSQFFHISGKINPADVVSHGEKSQDLGVDRWCRGPEFLKSYKCE